MDYKVNKENKSNNREKDIRYILFSKRVLLLKQDSGRH